MSDDQPPGPVNSRSSSSRSARLSSFVDIKLAWWAALPGNVRGAVWMSLAAAVFTVMVSLIKIAGESLHVTEILLFRQIFMFLFVLPQLIHGFPGVFKTERLDLHGARILCAVAAMTLGFSAFIHLPLADATTISFAKSFFITIFAMIILGEMVGYRRWLALLVGFVGVLIVLRPGGGGETFNIYGFMALGGAACAAMVMVIIRKVSQIDRPLTIMAYQAIGVGLLITPPAIYFWKTPTLEELGLLFVIGAVSIFAQLGNILAFRAGEASSIAVVEYVRLVYAVILGLVVFAHWPEPEVFVGAAIIIGASVYTIRREAQLGKKPGRAALPSEDVTP